jgi:Na+-translocating ferredoxin:NAD+ oxidoreductase subunit E
MLLNDLRRGIVTENPLLVSALGLCPALAVSTSLSGAFAMGLAVALVLICSNVLISLLRGIIPVKIRIPCYMTIIAGFVTVVQLLFDAYVPRLSHQLGIFIPLIAVNCVVLGRAESFASRHNVIKSFVDGVAIGLGFIIALCSVSILREGLGSNRLLGFWVFPGFKPMNVFLLAPGGFFILALVVGAIRFFGNRKKGGSPC